MKTIELEFTLPPGNKELEDILIAYLIELGYYGFWNKQNTINAYINFSDFDEINIKSLLNHLPININYSKKVIEEKNWNAEWEKNFNPIIINNRCIVKAPFHKVEQQFDYEILIEPKMAFGTGHHETTRLVIIQMLSLPFKGKKVMDIGCGSGILSILAEKLGSSKVLAIDNDIWAYYNTINNIEINQCQYIEVKHTTIQNLKIDHFNIILANINRNVILSDLEYYKNFLILDQNSFLILSGFLSNDMNIILDAANKFNFIYYNHSFENDWCCLTLKPQA